MFVASILNVPGSNLGHIPNILRLLVVLPSPYRQISGQHLELDYDLSVPNPVPLFTPLSYHPTPWQP